MDAFGLSSYDAVHAASVEVANFDSILTTDTDFAAVPEERLAIFINTAGVATCRRRRR